MSPKLSAISQSKPDADSDCRSATAKLSLPFPNFLSRATCASENTQTRNVFGGPPTGFAFLAVRPSHGMPEVAVVSPHLASPLRKWRLDGHLLPVGRRLR